jgi:hypothetical protein
MHRGLKVVLGLAVLVVVAVGATAGGTSVWLKGRLQDPEYCAGCHVMAPYYSSWKQSPFTAHTHAKLGLKCQDCHTRTVRDGLRELVSNATGSFDVPLEDHPPGRETCLRCHGSYQILAARTQNLLGPDGFALGRNPHDSHWGPIDCGICHKMHKPSQDFCSECHGSPNRGPAWAEAQRVLRPSSPDRS